MDHEKKWLQHELNVGELRKTIQKMCLACDLNVDGQLDLEFNDEFLSWHIETDNDNMPLQFWCSYHSQISTFNFHIDLNGGKEAADSLKNSLSLSYLQRYQEVLSELNYILKKTNVCSEDELTKELNDFHFKWNEEIIFIIEPNKQTAGYFFEPKRFNIKAQDIQGNDLAYGNRSCFVQYKSNQRDIDNQRVEQLYTQLI